MNELKTEIARFTEARQRQQEAARRCAAFFIMTGIDLAVALASRGDERARILLRVERLLERERLKGARRHWSYDLNRHIALKDALDQLRGGQIRRRAGKAWAGRPKESGARGRRISNYAKSHAGGL